MTNLKSSQSPSGARPTTRVTASVTNRRRYSGRTLGIVVISAALLVSVVVFVATREGNAPTKVAAPVVGGDLHAVAVIDGRRFVSGHEGAGFSDTDGAWRSIPSLGGKDGMGWASVPGRILVGGHSGLYGSDDEGVTFAAASTDLPITDVHALGAASSTVYLASPQGGLFVSEDGGASFDRRSDAGMSFMGTMIVDPADPEHVIAPDMSSGIVESVDGGRTWQSLGGLEGAMSVAWDPGDHDRIVATGVEGSALSSDGGTSWLALPVPTGTMVTTFGDTGRVIAAVLAGDRAEVYVTSDEGTTWKRV